MLAGKFFNKQRAEIQCSWSVVITKARTRIQLAGRSILRLESRNVFTPRGIAVDPGPYKTERKRINTGTLGEIVTSILDKRSLINLLQNGRPFVWYLSVGPRSHFRYMFYDYILLSPLIALL